MPKFTQEDVKAAMDDIKNVRNVMTAGAMASGKTCALDCLGAYCALVAEDKIGETRFAHVRQDEKDKGCTIKSSLTTLVLDKTVMHFADVPGHVEYSAELTVMVPIVDGALICVDGSKDSLPVATGQQLKQLGQWNVEPVLVLNKLDVSLLVTQKDGQEICDDVTQIIEALNNDITAKYKAEKPTLVNPEVGNVLFGSLGQGWLFSIPKLAEFYASKMQLELPKMCTRLWGEAYFNPSTKKWSNLCGDGSVRGFVKLIIDPIKSVLSTCEGGDMAKLEKLMKNLGATLQPADKKLEGTALFRRMMQLWMPAGPCIKDALEKFVPNPKASQEKRFELFTTAPTTDPCAVAVKNCANNGPLMFHIVKLTPQPSTAGRFFAMGRVFSGTLGADKCYLLDDDYVPPHAVVVEEAPPAAEAPAEGEAAAAEEEGSPEAADPAEAEAAKKAPKAKKDKGALQERRIQGVMTCQAKQFNAIPSVPAGNLCVCSGVDQFITKRASLSGSKDNFPFRKGAFAVSAVVRVSLQPKSAKDLPKVVEGLRRLAKSCPLVEVALEDGGQHAIAGCGEEHMRLLRKDLETEYVPGLPLQWDAPSVSYRETVTAESSIMCLSKSPNKHNRLFVKAEPLLEEVNQLIETQQVWPTQDVKKRARKLAEFGWTKEESVKIWGFGPAPEEAGAAYGANVLVDQTKGVQYLNEIKESVNSGLLWATREGPICEENMRGIRFNIYDVKLHADSIHRGMGQIQPTARRVFYACCMTAACRLVEPIFISFIECTADATPGIMQALGSCRGELKESVDLPGGRVAVEAYVPIAETLGATPFATVLSQKTNGKAAASYAFDHWEIMPSNPLEYDPKKKIETKAATIMLSIRKRKGLKEEPPMFADYYDKL